MVVVLLWQVPLTLTKNPLIITHLKKKAVLGLFLSHHLDLKAPLPLPEEESHKIVK